MRSFLLKGMPFRPDISDFMTKAMACHGNIQQLATLYEINKSTMHHLVSKVAEYREIIVTVREYNTDSDLDLAEHVFRYNMMNLKNNAGLAQRAAEKVVDGKGRKRGWNADETSYIPPNDSKLGNEHETIKLKRLLDLNGIDYNDNKSKTEPELL